MKPAKPRIALSTKVTMKDGQMVHSPAMEVMKAALEQYGAEVAIIDPRTAKPEEIRQFDAAVFMGNSLDIEPSTYGAAPHPATKSERGKQVGQSTIDHELAVARADYEEAAMKIALENNIPLLGICGGMQRLNVLLGGTLNQHLANAETHNVPAAGIYTPVQAVNIFPNTGLATLAGDTRAVWKPSMTDENKVYQSTSINSTHHQAVKDVGKGLVVCARTNDHTIEAIESADPNRFILGLQWHPEFLPESPLSQKIIGGVVEAAKQHAQGKAYEKPVDHYPLGTHATSKTRWQDAILASKDAVSKQVNGR